MCARHLHVFALADSRSVHPCSPCQMAACTVRNLAYHTINTDPEQSVLGVNAAAAVVSGDSADHYDDPLREGAMTVLMMHVGTILDMLPGQADQADVSVAEVLLR